MDVQTDRESDAVAAVTVSRLSYWLIKSYFDIWNSASRASLTKWKESISCSSGPRHKLGDPDGTGLRSRVPENHRGQRAWLARKLIKNKGLNWR